MYPAITFIQSIQRQQKLETIYVAISRNHVFYDRNGKKIPPIVKLIVDEAKDQIALLQMMAKGNDYGGSSSNISGGIGGGASTSKKRYNPYFCSKDVKYNKFIDQ